MAPTYAAKLASDHQEQAATFAGMAAHIRDTWDLRNSLSRELYGTYASRAAEHSKWSRQYLSEDLAVRRGGNCLSGEAF